MIDRALIMLLAGCALFAGIIVLELEPSASNEPSVISSTAGPEAQPQSRIESPTIDGLLTTARTRPLFSATRRPPDKVVSANGADPDLSDVRLAGIIFEPERHLAIFAISGAKPLVRLEGEDVKEWRLDSISPNEVSLSGPGGVRTLAPRPDPHIVRQLPAVLAVSPGAPAGRPGTNAGPPQAVTVGRAPVPAANTAQPASAPAQPQAAMGPAPVRAPNLAPMPRPNAPRPPQ